MATKLKGLAGIGDRIPDFVAMAGSLDDAKKWERLLRYLADRAAENAETGYHTYRLEEGEEADILYWHTFSVLEEMGVDIPSPFPTELDFDYDDDTNGDEEALHERIEELLEHPYVSLIYAIYRAYTDVYGFYAAYVSDLIDELDLFDVPACNIEPEFLALAASKLENPPSMAANFLSFKRKINKDYEDALTFVKEKAFQAGLPLQAELLDLVHDSHDSLGHEAEAASFGINKSRLHPDIYMNELLVGMRIIHQVLPAILKKLGLYEEFVLDETDLNLHRSR
ncbi:XRE family transcriptional regulator [Pigmentiphaga sp. YJ18]|uniref:XRE family transcriptional regulator n=1 Tax=Pigmentiphaga sp. YJ18 TaxID=3134907 RepID=UPI00310D75BA